MDVGKRADGYKEEETETERGREKKKKQGVCSGLVDGDVCGTSDAQEVFAPKSGCAQDGKGGGGRALGPYAQPHLLGSEELRSCPPSPNLVKSEPHITITHVPSHRAP